MISRPIVVPLLCGFGRSSRGFCLFLHQFSGGSVDEPGRTAAGSTALQSAMEDPVQGHERRAEGSSSLVL